MAITITARTNASKKKTVMLQLDPALYDSIAQLAKAANYPVAPMITAILRESVAQVKIQK